MVKPKEILHTAVTHVGMKEGNMLVEVNTSSDTGMISFIAIKMIRLNTIHSHHSFIYVISTRLLK